MRRRKRWGRLAGAAVLGASVPAFLRWLRRAGESRRSVDLRMTVIVERPIAEVFEFCRDFENFPRLVDVLLKVEDFQDGTSHWSVRSPSGATIEWDSVVTKYVPHSVIAWESEPGSDVLASGLMRFSPLSPEETRVDVTLRYYPRKTKLGEAVRALMAPSNTTRLRAELSNASRELARR
jgi:uncharacterized membrane protein